MLKADVLIVGGGPAGSAAALSLLTYTDLDVVIVERSDLCQQRVGEHVSASLFQLLDYLQLKTEDFAEGCFLPAYGNISYWGHDLPSPIHTISTPEGPTYQLDRECFDLRMLEIVAERGGQILPRTRCTDLAQRPDATWSVDLSHPERGAFGIEARYLIDATGRKASVCRQLGVPSRRHDALMGLGCFFRLSGEHKAHHEQLIEATEDGWWYTARLPGDRLTATFFTDADIVAERRLNKLESWLDQLRQSRHVIDKLGGVDKLGGANELLSDKPWARDACSQITDATQVSHMLAVGDAATAFDPISAMGIGSAISSACHGARLVHAQLAGHSGDATDQFQRDLEENFARYLALRGKFYGAERRWRNRPFWARRAPD